MRCEIRGLHTYSISCQRFYVNNFIRRSPRMLHWSAFLSIICEVCTCAGVSPLLCFWGWCCAVTAQRIKSEHLPSSSLPVIWSLHQTSLLLLLCYTRSSLLGPSWLEMYYNAFLLPFHSAVFLRNGFTKTFRILRICGNLTREKTEADVLSVFFGLLFGEGRFLRLSIWQPIIL